MRLKLSRASRMAEAMAQVRAELGEDALILSTRRVADGVEITAALENLPPPRALPPDPRHVRALAYHGVAQSVASTLLSAPLPVAVANALRFAPLDLDTNAKPLLFVGPPGAGKTLTVARLATRLVLAGVRPMVITADGRRAGAAEQLAAFTRLLGLDLIVASQPVALSRALARRCDGVPVLIDMPGGCPFDPVQLDEINALVSTANGQVALVLPAGLDPQEASETATAFATAEAKYLVVTRTDISRRIGCLVAAAATGLALSEVGIGAGAADGLIPITPEWLAERLLETPHDLEPKI